MVFLSKLEVIVSHSSQPMRCQHLCLPVVSFLFLSIEIPSRADTALRIPNAYKVYLYVKEDITTIVEYVKY